MSFYLKKCQCATVSKAMEGQRQLFILISGSQEREKSTLQNDGEIYTSLGLLPCALYTVPEPGLSVLIMNYVQFHYIPPIYFAHYMFRQCSPLNVRLADAKMREEMSSSLSLCRKHRHDK